MVDQQRVAILEQPAWRKDEISMLNLDEYVLLLSKPGVVHTTRPQCPFGAKPFKSTSFITYGVSVSDMGTQCSHSIKKWYRQGDASRIYARHPPSRGRHRYYLTTEEAFADTATPKRFVASGLVNYPALLTSFLAIKILTALRSAQPSSAIAAPKLQHCWENRAGKEQVIFLEKLKGLAEDKDLAAKKLAEDLAIGGLRDSLKAVGKLNVFARIWAGNGY